MLVREREVSRLKKVLKLNYNQHRGKNGGSISHDAIESPFLLKNMEETKTKNEWEKRLRDYFHANVSIVGEHWIEGMIKIVNGILSSERQKWEEEKLIIPKGKTHSEHDECENCLYLGRDKERQRLRERIEKMKVFIDYPDTEDGRKSRHENRLYNSALDKVLKLLKK